MAQVHKNLEELSMLSSQMQEQSQDIKFITGRIHDKRDVPSQSFRKAINSLERGQSQMDMLKLELDDKYNVNIDKKASGKKYKTLTTQVNHDQNYHSKESDKEGQSAKSSSESLFKET